MERMEGILEEVLSTERDYVEYLDDFSRVCKFLWIDYFY